MGKSIQQMREAISRCYDGDGWKDKCLHKMPTAQVWAVYHRFIKDGKLDKQGRPIKFQKIKQELRGLNTSCVIIDEWAARELTPTGKQMDFFDEIYKQLNKES
jgi:hypothetical protein